MFADKSTKEFVFTMLLVVSAEEIITARFDNKVYTVLLHRDDFGLVEHFVVGSQPKDVGLSLYFSKPALLAAESGVVLLNGSKIVSTIILGFIVVTYAISFDGSKAIVSGHDFWKVIDGTFLTVTLIPSIKLVTAARFASTQLASIYGAAFQMQKELQCFDYSLLILGVPCYSKIVGSLAGKHGQYRAWMTYYIIYNLSHITKYSPQYKVLMLGHVLGGIATSLLLASFQSWLVAKHKKKGFYIQWLSLTFSKDIFLFGVKKIYFLERVMLLVFGLFQNDFVHTLALGHMATFDTISWFLVIVLSVYLNTLIFLVDTPVLATWL